MRSTPTFVALEPREDDEWEVFRDASNSVLDHIRLAMEKDLDEAMLGRSPLEPIGKPLTADMMAMAYDHINQAMRGKVIELRCNDDMLGIVNQTLAMCPPLDDTTVAGAFGGLRAIEDDTVPSGCVRAVRHEGPTTLLRLRET